MQNTINCYNMVTEVGNFVSVHDLYEYLTKKLEFEKGDNLMLVTCKIKMPEKYWVESTNAKKASYIAREISEYIIKQINYRMNRQKNPFRDMALLHIIEKFLYGAKGAANDIGNTVYFYDIINMKNYTMDDIRQNIANNPLGKNGNFKIAYESATGQSGKYTKPFNKYVYFEILENPENFLLEFIEYNKNINPIDCPSGIYFGNCKFNTVRHDYSVFMARIGSEDTDWIKITTKAEIESENKMIKNELEHPVFHKSCTAEDVLNMIYDSVI